MRISDNKGNVTNLGIINNTIQNNVELTLEQKMEIKVSFKEFIKAVIGKLTYKFIGNFKLEKELFEKNIIAQIENIDTKKIVEPRLSVVGPTIENLKYNMTEEQIRKMYENILIGELNEDIHSKIRPAYIEIVKQLSKEDAQFLSMLKNNNFPHLTIIEIRYGKKSSYIEIDKKILVNEMNTKFSLIDYDYLIIDNLTRLKILNVENSFYVDSQKKCEQFFNEQIKPNINISKKEENKEIYYETKILELTTFGKNFIDICCS